MKGNECSSKLYIIYCGFVGEFSVFTGEKASKFTENHFFKRTESQEEIQTK